MITRHQLNTDRWIIPFSTNLNISIAQNGQWIGLCEDSIDAVESRQAIPFTPCVATQLMLFLDTNSTSGAEVVTLTNQIGIVSVPPVNDGMQIIIPVGIIGVHFVTGSDVYTNGIMEVLRYNSDSAVGFIRIRGINISGRF